MKKTFILLLSLYATFSFAKEIRPLKIELHCLERIQGLSYSQDYNETEFLKASKDEQKLLLKAEVEAKKILHRLKTYGMKYIRSFIVNVRDDNFGVRVILAKSELDVYEGEFFEVLFAVGDSHLNEKTSLIPLKLLDEGHYGADNLYLLCAK